MRAPVSKPLCSGLLFIIIGVAAFFKSQSYEIGSATDMGPGYIPSALGILLTVFGAATIWRSWASGAGEPLGKINWASMAAVTLGVILFALTIERFGMAVGIAVLVASTCYKRILRHPFEVLVTYLILLGISVGLFIYFLGLPLALFGANS